MFPKSVEQVQAIVRWANQHKVGLVPSGGRTGLSAAAVAANGEVVVAFDYMNRILDFNAFDRTVVCQPGVVTKQLQTFAEENGLYYPVDFASSGSSQIGGNIGTNAGGIKVIRYGMTRNWVAGMKVVTGKGDLLELNKDLIKNATGYDMRQLFIGAEGTPGLRGRGDHAPGAHAEEPHRYGPRHARLRLDHAGAACLPEQARPDRLRVLLRQGPWPRSWPVATYRGRSKPTARSTPCWSSRRPPRKSPTRRWPPSSTASSRAGC